MKKQEDVEELVPPRKRHVLEMTQGEPATAELPLTHTPALQNLSVER
jgi:hypothetical protein